MLEKTLLCGLALIVVPYIAAALLSAHINRVYRGYLGVKSRLNMDANELIERAASEEGFSIRVVSAGHQVSPSLEDCYGDGTVYLSHYNHRSQDVVALAVAAHEFGHAFQDFKADNRFVLRSSMLAQPTLGFALGFLTLLFGLALELSGVLAVGAAIWAIALLVDINTLKNEYDASRIARELLETRGMPQEELLLCDHMWKICAQSYVAAILKHMAAAILIVLILLGAKKE